MTASLDCNRRPMDSAEVSMMDIEASTQALCSQVARLLIAEALKDPRLARFLSVLEHGLQAALDTAPTQQAPRQHALAGLREDLGPLLRVFEPPLSERPQHDLAARLEQRQREHTARLEACGRTLHQHAQRSCDELATGLAALDTQLGRLKEQLEEQLTQWPARAPFEPDIPRPAAAAPQTALSWHPHVLYAGVMLVALLLAAALAAHRLGIWPQRAPQTPWEQLWGQALAQPVLGCRELRGAQTFVACVCPTLDTATASLGAQCSPSPDWPRHRLIGALEAVLRVKQPDLVWVDWEPGPELSQALQSLRCNLPPEARLAREALVSSSEDGGSEVLADDTRDAALTLLGYLQQHPACAG